VFVFMLSLVSPLKFSIFMPLWFDGCALKSGALILCLCVRVCFFSQLINWLLCYGLFSFSFWYHLLSLLVSKPCSYCLLQWIVKWHIWINKKKSNRIFFWSSLSFFVFWKMSFSDCNMWNSIGVSICASNC
jgi:hypothetical protein